MSAGFFFFISTIFFSMEAICSFAFATGAYKSGDSVGRSASFTLAKTPASA